MFLSVGAVTMSTGPLGAESSRNSIVLPFATASVYIMVNGTSDTEGPRAGDHPASSAER